ncbi:MAG: ModD protein, partial [Gordonibacter urolithinfaciens]
IPPEELATLVAELRANDPPVTLVAAGGINPGNAAAYAATGVDGLATTAPFAAKPLDMSVRMRRL